MILHFSQARRWVVLGSLMTLATTATFGQSPQAGSPRNPAAATMAEAVVLTNGWGALSQNDLATAEGRARQALLLSPRSPGAFALLLEVAIARHGVTGGSEFYDQWVGARPEEPTAVRRLATAWLYETAFGPEAFESLNALMALFDEGDDKARRRLEGIENGGSLAEARQMAARGHEGAVRRLAAVVGRALPAVTLALQALGDSRSPLALEAVRGRLADPRSEVRAEAAAALGRIGGLEVSNELVPLLKDPSHFVRLKAAEALFAAGHPAGDGVLGELARSPDSGARLAAARAMATRPAAEWPNLVVGLLSDPDPEVRLGGAQLARQFDRTLSDQILQELAGSAKNPVVRAQARLAMIQDLSHDLRQLRLLLADADETVALAAAKAILAATR